MIDKNDDLMKGMKGSNVRLNVDIERRLYEEFKEFCIKDRRSMSIVLRGMVEDFLKKENRNE